MGETAELPGQAGSVPVRRMRVARPVGKGVMTTVDRDPADDLTLEAHRPRDRQRDAQRRDRGEAAMSQQAVKAHRHTKAGQHIQQHDGREPGGIVTTADVAKAVAQHRIRNRTYVFA